MNKVSKVLVGVFGIVLLTGCNSQSKKLVCTKSTSQSGLNIEQSITMNFTNNKVSTVKIDVNSKAEDDLIKNNWEIFVNQMDKQYPVKTSDSKAVKLVTKNDEKNYTYLVSIEVDLNKATKSDLEEYNLEDAANDNSKLEDVKKQIESDGYTCK